MYSSGSSSPSSSRTRTSKPSSSNICIERSAAFAPAASGSKLTTMRPEWRFKVRTCVFVSAVPQLATTFRTSAEWTHQLMTGRFRETQPECGDLVGSEPAAGEIIARFRSGRRAEILLKDAGGDLVHLQDGAAQFRIRIRILALGHRDAVALGQ